MTSPLVQRLTGVRDLKRILETTVRELGDTFNADTCQVMLSNPLDPNVTQICEYRAPDEEGEELGQARVTVPLVLQGRTFGSVSMARQTELSLDELNSLRVVLGELGDIIRLAQINDVVQRDTFRETFLVEIGNVMAYSMGIGDALFLVVNILGKALNVSRCLFVCTDDAQAGWKCYEFWQQDKVRSCQEFYWPSTDSPMVAQVLLSRMPMTVYEGQENSYVSPVQEELQFIGVKSLLGVALTTGQNTHGCVILQQCDYRRAWTRSEVDMVQNVADKVAEALVKLPAEKLAREPIMQLHQRIVPPAAEGDGKSTVQLRNALKGALGQQAIPSARKTTAPAPPPAPKPATPPAPPPTPGPAPAPTQAAAPAQPVTPPPAPPAVQEAATPAGDSPKPVIKPVTRTGGTQDAIVKPPEGSVTGIKSFDSIKGVGVPRPDAATASGSHAQVDFDLEAVPPVEEDPYADLDFGEFGDIEEAEPKAASAPAPAEPVAAAPSEPVAAPPGETVAPAEAEGKGAWGDLDSIPAPRAKEAAPGQWGDLDSIPTPAAKDGNQPVAGGLKGSMLAKAKAASAASPLMSSLRKKEAAAPAAEAPPPSPPMDEAEAKKKLDQIMASSANETSDYIFATPGLDARMLGRIDGWVAQIEEKDKYPGGHARQVAQYAVAIAQGLGMKAEEVQTVRQAALVHDLGKLGIAKPILQKGDDALEDDEFVLKMGHSVAGAQLLESFPELKHLAPLVIAHHEEFDGEGFPQGLKGDEIPVIARILAVANSYHELVAAKVNGTGMEPEAAQKQMIESAGKQFDPTFVEALVQSIKEGKVPASC